MASGVFRARTVQNVGQKLANHIECGGHAKRNAGVIRDIVRTLPTFRSPDTGDRTCPYHPAHFRDRESLNAVGIPSSEGAKDGVTSPLPESVLPGGEIPVVFVKCDRDSVSNGL